jgi:hypothetical protein
MNRHLFNFLFAACSLSSSPMLIAQQAPFYGLTLPGPATLQTLNFNHVDFPPLAARAGEAADPEPAELHRHISELVNIALDSRQSNPQRWGNFSGYPEEERVISYLQQQLQNANVQDLDLKVFDQAPWSLTTHWQASVQDPNGNSVELQSAVPMGVGNRSSVDELEAGLSYLGRGSAADLAGRDVSGKIAVIRGEVAPQFYDISTRDSQARLEAAGAAGVIRLWDTPGNMQVQLGDCPTISCFNLGGEDSAFLEALIVEAASRGQLEQLRMSLSMTVEREVRQARNLLGRIPGNGGSDENILLVAHTDTWFGGADDNASGLAVMLELARYFSMPQNRPQHDIYILASPGHHHAAGGTGFFVETYPQILADNMLTINLEHVASTGVSRIDAFLMDGVKDNYGNIVSSLSPTNWDSPWHGVAMSDKTSFLVQAWQQAAADNMYTQPASAWEPAARSVPGEAAALDAAGALVIQNPETSHWYHSSGATAETISPESLQRAYLFFKDLIRIADAASKAEIWAP